MMSCIDRCIFPTHFLTSNHKNTICLHSRWKPSENWIKSNQPFYSVLLLWNKFGLVITLWFNYYSFCCGCLFISCRPTPNNFKLLNRILSRWQLSWLKCRQPRMRLVSVYSELLVHNKNAPVLRDLITDLKAWTIPDGSSWSDNRHKGRKYSSCHAIKRRL